MSIRSRVRKSNADRDRWAIQCFGLIPMRASAAPELRCQPATGNSAVMILRWVFAGFQVGFWFVLIPTLGFTVWSHATPAPGRYEPMAPMA